MLILILSVHPRLRGELFDFFNVRWLNNGSSPLTRGTHTFIFCQLGGRRFIPAYAGNSALACSRRARRSVHPRLRGELILVLRPALIHIGSSPLTRGTRLVIALMVLINRFIPAYAGNSVSILRANLKFSVHPRLRGELGEQKNPGDSTDGSSPLTRGTRTEKSRRLYGFRFIPAYAGNSLKDGINPSIHTLGI